jgi:hypothetical protein
LAIRRVPKEMRKGLNSLTILVSWEVWKHRNSCVFEGASPSVQELLQTIGDECSLWSIAAASKLNDLLARSLTPGELASAVEGWSCFLFCHKHSLPCVCVCVGDLEFGFFSKLGSVFFSFFYLNEMARSSLA